MKINLIERVNQSQLHLDQDRLEVSSGLSEYQTAQQFLMKEHEENVDTQFFPTAADLNIFHE